MLAKAVSIGTASLLSAALLAQSGCTCPSARGSVCVERTACGDTVSTSTVALGTEDMPPNAVPGECYAKVFIPPRTETRTERVCIREASERIEVVPAKYDWVEERVLVKEASCELQIVPAEYGVEERRVEVEPGHTRWHVENAADCDTKAGQKVENVFCLVKTPPVYRTIQTEVLKRPAQVRQVNIPAEYKNVRVRKLVQPATTRCVKIPAEYETIEKTVVCGPGRIEWQPVVCERNATAAKVNQIKRSLLSKGYAAGPLNGQLDKQSRAALVKFQAKNNLNTDGILTYATMDKLGVPVR